MENIAHAPIGEHFTAITKNGAKLVYCPVGNLFSWHPGDHDHRWCPFCKQGFEELEK